MATNPRMKPVVASIILAVIALTAYSVVGAPIRAPSSSRNLDHILLNVRSPSAETRCAVLDQYPSNDEVQEFVDQLVKIIQEDPRPSSRLPQGRHDPKHIAFLVLAELPLTRLRVDHVVAVCLENLDYERHEAVGTISMVGPEFYFPAVKVVRCVGRPAMSPLVQRIGMGIDSDRIKNNCLHLLEAHYGRELTLAVLRAEHEKYKDESYRKNLDKAIEVLEKRARTDTNK